MNRASTFVLVLVSGSLLPLVAAGHPGAGGAGGFAQGFLHPFTGLDHASAMIGIGLLAAHLGGRARWGLPAGFLLLVVLGAAAAYRGIAMPHVEAAIAASVVTIGALIALRPSLSGAVVMLIAGFFAFFHGHAHGAEMPVAASPFGYVAGFTLAMASLHCLGLALGIQLARSRVRVGFARCAGAGMSVAGALMLAGQL